MKSCHYLSKTSDAPAGIADYINSTQTMPAPTSKDVSSSYAASDTALVQMDSTGALYYVTGAFGNGWQVPTGLSWQKLGYTLAGVTGTGSSSVAASSSGTVSRSASAAATASSTGAAGNAAQSGSRSASGSASGSTAPAASASNTSGALGSFGALDVALVSVALSCLGLAMAF